MSYARPNDRHSDLDDPRSANGSSVADPEGNAAGACPQTPHPVLKAENEYMRRRRCTNIKTTSIQRIYSAGIVLKA